MPGMRDVAKEAGVSLSTVSVILNNNNSKYVSQENIEKVIDAVEKLGYKLPSPKNKYTKTIAIVLPMVTSTVFSTILSGIENEADRAGYQILLCDSKSSFEKELSIIQQLKKRNLSGIILDSLCPISKEQDYLELLRKELIETKDIPIVFLERWIEREDFYSIGLDEYKNAYTATHYLHKIGCDKIAHIQGPSSFASSEKRFKGYFQALKDCNLEPDFCIIEEGDCSPLSGYVAMKKILLKCSDINGLFAANDQLAIGAIKAIKEAGKKVPEDIAVVGFGNISHATLIEPALTTVNIPAYEMGRKAANIVIDYKRELPTKQLNRLDGNLIVRKSTDVLATNEWELLGW